MRTVYEDFKASRKVTIRIFRPELQWPMYGATPERAQAQAHIRLRPPFRTVWSVGLGTLIEFPAVVDDGVAYIGNAHATIRAISMRFGTVLWRHDTPHGRMASSPAVVGQTLVYHSMDGHVYVLDRGTGRLVRQYSFGSPIESSPIVRRGVDYFGAWNGRLYALDLRTHRLRWSRSLGAKITSSAAIAGGTLYIGDYGGRLWLSRRSRDRRVGPARSTAASTGRLLSPAADLRAVVERRLVDGLLGARPLPVAHRHGLVRLFLAGRLGRRVFFGAYNGVFYASRPQVAGFSGRSAPAARSPAPPWSWTAWPTPEALRTASWASTLATAVFC